jgi:hypothetical protein
MTTVYMVCIEHHPVSPHSNFPANPKFLMEIKCSKYPGQVNSLVLQLKSMSYFLFHQAICPALSRSELATPGSHLGTEQHTNLTTTYHGLLCHSHPCICSHQSWPEPSIWGWGVGGILAAILQAITKCLPGPQVYSHLPPARWGPDLYRTLSLPAQRKEGGTNADGQAAVQNGSGGPASRGESRRGLSTM